MLSYSAKQVDEFPIHVLPRVAITIILTYMTTKEENCKLPELHDAKNLPHAILPAMTKLLLY